MGSEKLLVNVYGVSIWGNGKFLEIVVIAQHFGVINGTELYT